MDFFGILFDMKNGKKIPYSKTYFDTLFAAKLGGSDVKTLTGALPLTFTTSETALRSWTIYGADIEHVETASGKSITFYTDEDKLRDWVIYGNDENGTKNLLEITATSTTISGVTFTVDKTSGTITVNGTASVVTRFPVSIVTAGDFYFSCQMPRGSNNTYYLYVYDRTTGANVKTWDGVTTTSSIYDSDSYEVKIVDGHETSAYIRIAKGYIANNVVFKPMLRPANTTATFEPYQIGVGQRTKNLLEITEETHTINGVTFTVDKQAGTVTANGTASANARFDFHTTEMTVNATDIINGIPDGASSSTYYILAEFENGANAFDSTLDNTAIGDRPNFTPRVLNWRIYVISGQTVNNLVFKPMLRAADTDAGFIPYGYEVPLTVSQTGHTDKTYGIYIGDTPLTEGETVSKSSTGVDIATAGGNNTITTSLYNHPDMSITYNEFTGVGILTANLFMIALKLKAGGQTESAFNLLMNKPLRAGETLTSEQTGQTINTVAGVENKLSPSPKAAAYGGNFKMTIKFKE